MLRSLFLALALGAPTLAAAEQFPESALGVEVRGHDGTLLGRVTDVERDGDGRIISVEIPGLEPGDAPASARDLVAENDRRLIAPDRARLARERVLAGDTQTRSR
ncbi:MAG: PRC-barrel domain-containing protein [Caulobacterales bacterium]|nr:PRC-barrel domain-containing protein [Caulobacterales bacterium]